MWVGMASSLITELLVLDLRAGALLGVLLGAALSVTRSTDDRERHRGGTQNWEGPETQGAGEGRNTAP